MKTMNDMSSCDQLQWTRFYLVAGLTSVIGVKYVSPAKGDGKPTIKVKSYVSDEYKELVDLAALHWDHLVSCEHD